MHKTTEFWNDLIPFSKAANYLGRNGRRPAISTLVRWATEGLADGRKLAAYKVGGKWHTTESALEEFIMGTELAYPASRRQASPRTMEKRLAELLGSKPPSTAQRTSPPDWRVVLSRVDCIQTRGPKSWTARCSLCGRDQLHIDVTSDGTIILSCANKNCTVAEILSLLGLSVSDLLPKLSSGSGTSDMNQT